LYESIFGTFLPNVSAARTMSWKATVARQFNQETALTSVSLRAKLKSGTSTLLHLTAFGNGILQHPVSRHRAMQTPQDATEHQATRNSCSTPSRSGSQRLPKGWKPSKWRAAHAAKKEVLKDWWSFVLSKAE
jgi:hypothetical protein